MEAPRSHQRVTRNNTPNTVPPIQTTTPGARRSPRGNPNFIVEKEGIDHSPNSGHIPMNVPRMISQEAVNILTNHVWEDTGESWIP